MATNTQDYTFYTVTADGVRLWVNGQLLINDCVNHDVATTNTSAAIHLVAGQKYDITMEYQENGGAWVAKLLWSNPEMTKQIIPQSALFAETSPVSVMGHPESTNVFIGQRAVFTVIAKGIAPLSYQWLRAGIPIQGATNLIYETLPVTSDEQNANFSVLISNIFGGVTSRVAVLSVNCTIQASAGSGGTISPSGYLSIQADSSQVFNITAGSGYEIIDVVVDGQSVGVRSSYEFVGLAASHSIRAVFGIIPTINRNPESASFLEGQPATFTVSASGYPLYYQWLRSDLPISGATNAVYISGAITTNDNETQFAVIVTNMFGSVTSSVAVLTVEPLDADGDGMYDRWEANLPYPNCSTNALRDEDNDGLNNLEEFRLGANPTNWDSDGDGLSDGLEVKNFVVTWTSPTNAVIHTNKMNAVSVAANDWYGLVLFSNGCVVGRGSSLYGSDWTSLPIPPAVSNAVTISADNAYNVALLSNGKVVAWPDFSGSPSYLFQDAVTNVPSSVSNAVSISAGNTHILTRLSNGKVIGWMVNGSGQTIIPSSVSNAMSISAGYVHSLALLSNGNAVCWNTVSSGQASIVGSSANAIAVSAGGMHSLALQSCGQVVGWGANWFGQINPPNCPMPAIAIAAGRDHSLALYSDGKVRAWGFNSCGQTNVPASVTNAVSIVALDDSSMALTSDGRIHGWGRVTDCGLRAKYSSYSVIEATTQGLAVARFSTCPTNNDTDGDKMLDKWEIDHGFDPTDPSDGALDSDGDGLSNSDEIIKGTDILNQDSDGDGISDREEVDRVAAGVDPQYMNPAVNNFSHDQDGDGLSLSNEFARGTDPFDCDSDGDGLYDGYETTHGTDPNVFNQDRINPNIQGCNVTVTMTETRLGGNTNSLMGRGIVTIDGHVLRVFSTNGIVSRTFRMAAGQKYTIPVIDGRPNDTNSVRITVNLKINGESVPTEWLDDPMGVLGSSGKLFPENSSTPPSGMKTAMKRVSASSSSSSYPGFPGLIIPSVKICYAMTTNEVPDYTELFWTQSLSVDAVVFPIGTSALLSWTHKAITCGGYWWWAHNWTERVDMLNPDGSLRGIYDTVVFYTAGSPHPKVDLELKNAGTIVTSPENEDYGAETTSAGGTDQLGPLPMGQGRGDFPGQAYTSPIMVIGIVFPKPVPAGVEFRWKRMITRRSWFILKNAAGTEWNVTQRTRRINEDDTGGDTFNDQTPSTALGKIYIYDCSALLPASGAGAVKAGDYIREEKAFRYSVEYRANGGAWTECAATDVGQIIRVGRKATTGNVAVDWDGLENGNAIRVLDAVIDEPEVRGTVGGTLPIVIDANANN